MKCLIESVSKYLTIRKNSIIFEIGCAQGLSLFALKEIGYSNVSGIEPSPAALKASSELSKHLDLTIKVLEGFGEKLPLRNNSVDFIFAQSVMEHVSDDEIVFKECFRVLKKGGGMYFSSTSIVCPAQSEIRFFPFFSWYPDRLKRRIMTWSVAKFPSLVGYTDAPAVNWYSRRKISRIAREIGYAQIIDRWELSAPDSGSGGFKDFIKNMINKIKPLRYIASLLFQGTEYLLIKR